MTGEQLLHALPLERGGFVALAEHEVMIVFVGYIRHPAQRLREVMRVDRWHDDPDDLRLLFDEALSEIIRRIMQLGSEPNHSFPCIAVDVTCIPKRSRDCCDRDVQSLRQLLYGDVLFTHLLLKVAYKNTFFPKTFTVAGWQFNAGKQTFRMRLR